MVVAISFNIKPTNARCFQLDGATGPEAAARGAGPQGAGTVGVVPTPPQLPYAPDPGTYIQICVAETEVTGVEELANECYLYCKAFTGNPME